MEGGRLVDALLGIAVRQLMPLNRASLQASIHAKQVVVGCDLINSLSA
jgi:NAD(P)H-hydrate repair Nnr-like enzyme with NAD(P)H-hydrate epimerase domain